MKTNKNQNKIKLNKQLNNKQYKPSQSRAEKNRKIECEWQQ